MVTKIDERSDFRQAAAAATLNACATIGRRQTRLTGRDRDGEGEQAAR